MLCGLRAKTRSASSQIVSVATRPSTAAVEGNPRAPIAMAHNGENRTPPMLAPLYAIASAAGRARTNQGDTSALIAEALVAPQPAPLKTAATKSCHGADAKPQPRTPRVRDEIPALVTVAAPNRAWSCGSRADISAPIRK